jgi:hypothetical protein
MPNILGIAKVGCGAILATVLALHAPILTRHKQLTVTQEATVSNQVVRQDEQIIELQRRVLVLETAKLDEQVAEIKSQQNIDHEILMAIAAMIFTLSIEALWRLGRRKQEAS